MLAAMPSSVHMAWTEAFGIHIDLDAMIDFFQACTLSGVEAALALWTYNL